MAATGIDPPTTPLEPTEDPEALETPVRETSLDRLRQAFGRLTNPQKIVLGAAVALLVATLVTVTLWMRPPNERVLFSNLSERDGGAIIAALEQMNIPYRFNDGGNAILIPTERVYDVRMRLATQGLPKGSGVGFELLENQKFGTSQFAEQINYQRGLEGELSRTIQSIAAVQAARVHLAMPRPSVFVREEQKPSASVMINFHPGRSLDAAQIAGIQNLVSASVPNLSSDKVTLIDQTGAMISKLKNDDVTLDAAQLKYVGEIEAIAIKRVEDILVPILGAGNFRVQVAADIDFSRSEQTAETYRPNTTPPDISIRSQQTSESASTMPSALGVPGALTNQPPVPATAPLTSPPVPGAGAPPANTPPVPGQINAAGVHAAISNVGQPVNTRKDSTVNYEIDRTIRYTKQSVGIVRRLTAAVVVNHRKDVKGVAKPLIDTELQQINNLVREAIGYSQERGDSVSVANAPFAAVEKAEALPAWKDPEMIQLYTEALKYLLIALFVAYLLFKVIVPLVRQMVEPPKPPEPPPVEGKAAGAKGEGGADGEEGEDEEGEEEEEAGPPEPDPLDVLLAQAREIAEKNPKAVANIIKDWMDNNAGGSEH